MKHNCNQVYIDVYRWKRTLLIESASQTGTVEIDRHRCTVCEKSLFTLKLFIVYECGTRIYINTLVHIASIDIQNTFKYVLNE